MLSGIYAIVNISDKKIYIGKSVDLHKREITHLWRLRKRIHPNPHLQHAFDLYGELNFRFIILERCEREALCDKEIYYIEKYHTNEMEKGYNLTGGGEGALGRKNSKATIEKMSRNRRGITVSAELKKQRSLIASRLWKDPAYIQKMRTRAKSKGPRGRKHTDAEKKHISEMLIGRKLPEESKKRLSKYFSGEKSTSVKLSRKQVIEIRIRSLNGEVQREIAKDYPVTYQTVNDIIRGRRWKSIPNTLNELQKLLEG